MKCQGLRSAFQKSMPNRLRYDFETWEMFEITFFTKKKYSYRLLTFFISIEVLLRGKFL